MATKSNDHQSPETITNLLPTLPLELQIQILSQIPPTNLFTLRRTCLAWKAMLSNPNLLDTIHNHHLPFLSSATSLELRLKRRQRMQRNEPVWVKPFGEVFPWAMITEFNSSGGNQKKWERFWKGWLVVMICPKGIWNLSEAKAGPPVLKIGHVLGSTKVVEINIHKLLAEKFPEFDKMDIEGDYECLHVQDGIVLLGLIVKLPLDEKLVILREYGYKTGDRRLEISHLISFDLSGTIISQISIPYRPASTYPPHSDFIEARLMRFNSTHLLAVSVFSNGEFVAGPLVPSCAINIYLLSTGERIAPEITVRGIEKPAPKEMLQYGVFLGIIGEINSRLGFDEGGMIWFPLSAWYDAELSCTDRSGEGLLLWEPNNLPLSSCGGWVVFSGIHGPPTKLATVHFPNFGGTYNNVQSRKPAEVANTTARRTTTQVLLLVNHSNTTLVLSHDSSEVVDNYRYLTRPFSWPSNQPPYYNLTFQSWKSKSQYPSTHNIKITPAELSAFITQFRRSNDENAAATTMETISAIWGYIGQSRYGPPSGLTSNINLLPYEDGAHAKPEYHCGIQTFEKLQEVSGDIDAEMDWHWGDDGLVVWNVGRRIGTEFNREVWVVCYEEEWGLQSMESQSDDGIEDKAQQHQDRRG